MTQIDPMTNNCYADFHWQGKTLAEWQEELHFAYSLGELYRMAREEKRDFSSL